MMDDEIYPRAPVQFVTFEVQFPMAPGLAKPEGREQVYDRLAEKFPLLETLGPMQIQFSVGGQQPLPFPQPGSQDIRMTTRSRNASVTVGAVLVRIEQAAHVSFPDLRELISEVLDAVQDAARIHGLQRATLRYVNEIQHPNTNTPASWTGLLHPSLLGPVDLLDVPAEATEGSALYRVDPQHVVRVTYGSQPSGFAVDPNGPLRVKPRPPGPFFKLDTESTWVAPADEVPPMVVTEVLTLADRLHAPVRHLFEAVITPSLRDYFRSPA